MTNAVKSTLNLLLITSNMALFTTK